MAQTTLSVRMDDSLKSDFDKVCNELGLSMTTAITMLAKKMTREKRLPFEVSVDPFYSDFTQKRTWLDLEDPSRKWSPLAALSMR